MRLDVLSLLFRSLRIHKHRINWDKVEKAQKTAFQLFTLCQTGTIWQFLKLFQHDIVQNKMPYAKIDRHDIWTASKILQSESPWQKIAQAIFLITRCTDRPWTIKKSSLILVMDHPPRIIPPSACSARPQLPNRVPPRSSRNCPALLEPWMRPSDRPPSSDLTVGCLYGVAGTTVPEIALPKMSKTGDMLPAEPTFHFSPSFSIAIRLKSNPYLTFSFLPTLLDIWNFEDATQMSPSWAGRRWISLKWICWV